MNIEIEMENGGIIKAELYPDVASNGSIQIFKKIQGGGFTADGQHKETDSIKGEFDGNGVTNPLKHTRGVLSMARTMFPNSASSQFFIMHEDAPHLDGQYAAFGKVTDGIEVVDEIAETPTDMQDKPIEDQIIKTIRLV